MKMTFTNLENTVEKYENKIKEKIEDELNLLDGYMTDLDFTSQLIDDTWNRIDSVKEQIDKLHKEFIENKTKITKAIKVIKGLV